MRMAEPAMIGGGSHIRSGGDRTANLAMDQYVGVGIGELAGNKYLFSVDAYIANRKARNANPTFGDGGSDTLGYKIDYKTSHARKSDLLSYNLVVRPRERHTGFVYVLGLVRAERLADPNTAAYLIGYATDDMLDNRMAKCGIFSGAYVIPAKELLPMAELRSNLFRIVQPTQEIIAPYPYVTAQMQSREVRYA